jgi:hypothetical protein
MAALPSRSRYSLADPLPYGDRSAEPSWHQALPDCVQYRTVSDCVLYHDRLLKKGPPPPWETSMASVTDGFSHVLLFSCPKCGNPLASAWASTEKNLGRADAQRLDRKCDCGWSGPLVGAQALRHWIEPWKNPVDVEPDGRRLRRQPHPSRPSACPKCASPLNHKSRRKGVLEQILHTVFFISPLRCEVCDERYFRVRFPTARSVHKHDSHAA